MLNALWCAKQITNKDVICLYDPGYCFCWRISRNLSLGEKGEGRWMGHPGNWNLTGWMEAPQIKAGVGERGQNSVYDKGLDLLWFWFVFRGGVGSGYTSPRAFKKLKRGWFDSNYFEDDVIQDPFSGGAPEMKDGVIVNVQSWFNFIDACFFFFFFLVSSRQAGCWLIQKVLGMNCGGTGAGGLHGILMKLTWNLLSLSFF